jgi:hypothetical protein
MRNDLDAEKQNIIQMLVDGTPRREVCRIFDCKYGTLRKRLEKWGHAGLKNPGRKGRKHPESSTPTSYYLESTQAISSYKLKRRLIRDGYKLAKCEICGLTEWNGLPAPLELDHINGLHSDNRLENLRIVCPNCHAQTPTNSGKSTRSNLWQ